MAELALARHSGSNLLLICLPTRKDLMVTKPELRKNGTNMTTNDTPSSRGDMGRLGDNQSETAPAKAIKSLTDERSKR